MDEGLKNATQYVHCVKCNQPMVAVFCHRIRDTCEECGGKSLVDTDEYVSIMEEAA